MDEGRDYDIDAERIFVHPQYDPKSKVVLICSYRSTWHVDLHSPLKTPLSFSVF